MSAINRQSNSSVKESNKNSTTIFESFPMLVLLGIYLAIAIVIMFLVAPYAIGGLRYMLIDMDPSTAIIIFVGSLIITITMVVMLIYVYSKTKLNKRYLNDEYNGISLYGEYNDERRYLEQKIDELTERLMNTEKKWKDINHLILSANDKNFDNNGKISPEKFLNEFGLDITNIEMQKDLVFVLTPSDNEFVSDYWVVRDTCKKVKLRALRGDEQDLNYTNSSILAHILKYIIKSRLVVANISNRNPNVYYELGIAHMLGKPSILLCRQGGSVPFDLQQKYIVFYSNEEELAIKLEDALLNILTIE